MKIRIDQKQLADAARAASRRLPNNPLQPMLSGLLIEASAETASLSGFDYETSTRALLDAEALEPGETLVSGRLLADVAAALPAGLVDLVADERELTVTTPGNSFTLPTMDRRDYPSLPQAPAPSGSIDGSGFAKTVVHAADAAMAPDEAVGNMEGFGGVEVAAFGDTLRLRATDRYRIVEHTTEWQPTDGDGSLVVPADALSKTAKALASGTVRIGFPGNGSSVAAFTGDNLTVTSRTMAVEFPDIGRLFPAPEAATGWAVFDSHELQAAVKRAALANEKAGESVRIAFDRDHATVHGGTGGRVGSSRVDCETADLDDFAIAFNPAYLAHLLAPIDGPVRLWLYTPTKPALIHPDGDDGGYRAVCMPIRIPR